MVGSDSPDHIYLFKDAWRRDRAGMFALIVAFYRSLMSFPQKLSPAKTVFTGIGILLAVCLFFKSLVARMCNV